MARLNGLYITADRVGEPTGGGKVTHHEWLAMKQACSPGTCTLWQFPDEPRPWGADLAASVRLIADPTLAPVHAHFYAGTFTKTIQILQSRGTRVTYTAAAHDIAVSRHEHELLGVPFDYPHLTDPAQWEAYVGGYLMADELICPSEYSAQIMLTYATAATSWRRAGLADRVRVIPHGYDPVDRIAPMPARFTVGYLGQPGPDKGLRTLIAAWELLSRAFTADWQNALLVIAGRGTLALAPLVRSIGGGSIYLRGQVADPRELYDACCVYVQPSASEGFGCEVLEARAHGRPVICSDGAGAQSHATWVVPAGDRIMLADEIATARETWRRRPADFEALARRDLIADLSWRSIRRRYEDVFRSNSWLPARPAEHAL